MITRLQILIAAAATALLAFGGSALATDYVNFTFKREVNSCIAEINDRANYDDATRVRHTVVEVKNTFAGYVLTIDTDVFTKSTESAVREYASYCVAKDDAKPSKFSINRISS